MPGLPLTAFLATTSATLVTTWALFGAVVAVLGLFVVGVAVVTFSRRRRGHRRALRDRGDASVDPWKEAGRRAGPW